MRKDRLFINAMLSEMYKDKRWIISAFAIIDRTGYSISDIKNPWDIVSSEGKWHYWSGLSNKLELIVDDNNNPISSKTPLFKFTDKLRVHPADAVNVPSTVETRYGVLLANYMLLIYPFHNKITYINGEMDIGKIEKEISEKMLDDGEINPSKISIDEYKTFAQATIQLEGYAQLCVPAATEKSITADPNTKQLIRELVERYKDTINEPTTIAKIDSEVGKLDRAWIKGDPSERFYTKDKAYDITRKKMYGVYGGEAGLGDGATMAFIDKPLSEGLDIEKLPDMINSIRSGSYDRGTQTALGGVAVKEFFRVFQNSNISIKDCASEIGIKRKVFKWNFKDFIGFYYFKNKTVELINEDIAKSLIGQIIEMRSPATCKTPLTDYCEVCMGENNSRSKTGLGASASEIGSKFMILFLKSMHGKSLKTEKFDIINDIV